MNVYVLGAGVSKCVGYPVGTELFDEIDKYVRGSGNLTDRFNYREDWNNLYHWLEANTNPTIAQAYQTKNIEHLFTILDFATELRNDALRDAAFSGREPEKSTNMSAAFDAYDDKIKDYQRYRSILLWALLCVATSRGLWLVEGGKVGNSPGFRGHAATRRRGYHLQL